MDTQRVLESLFGVCFPIPSRSDSTAGKVRAQDDMMEAIKIKSEIQDIGMYFA